MAHFGNSHKLLFGISILATVLLIYSCKEKEDFRYAGDNIQDSPYDEISDDDSLTLPELDLTKVYTDTIHYDSVQTAQIQVLQTHTKGKGFPIVIMADGYTSGEIADGTYRKAVEKAQTAVFAMEPMKSLKQYCDVIEVALTSNESGITTKKKDTALKTHYVSGNNTDVYGDSNVVKRWTQKALTNAYDMSYSSSLKYKMERCQTIVLLNCTAYKGITLLEYSQTVTDGYPLGFAFSYIPTNTVLNTKDVFTDIIQHEAVGHGIGKLADEYFYPSTSSPSQSDITNFQTLQKYGMMLNAAYDTLSTGDTYAMSYNYNGIMLSINKHPLSTSDAVFPLTQDSRYRNEDITWYQGGYTFLTYTKETASEGKGYVCEKNFYRPSMYSLMNSTGASNNKTFNALSRYAIYKRLKRAALGTLFTCDLSISDAFEAFADFDAPSRTSSSSAKAMMTDDDTFSQETIPDVPALAPPIIIRR